MKLLSIITCVALAIPAAMGQAERCPYARGVQEPLPSASAPRSDIPVTTCRSNLTRSYQREGTFTRVTFRQDDSLPPNAAVAAAIDEAIGAALDLFGSHAGNASLPLDIHLTLTDTSAIASGTAAFKTDPSSAGRPLVLFDSFAAPGPHTASPCFLLAGPPRAGDVRAPLLRLKKDVVRAMYHCTQQFMHHEVAAPERTHWWRLSLARFVDGLAFPATRELVPKPTLMFVSRSTAFPEDFDPRSQWALRWNDGAAFSLFWHWLHSSSPQNGWTLARIADWLRAYPRVVDYQLHMTRLALDPDMPGLFRAFGRAFLLGELHNLTYPGGQPIALSRPESSDFQREMARPFLDDSGGVRLAPGEERVADRPRPEAAKLRARNWAMDLWNVTLAGGQTVDVTIRPTKVVDWWAIEWLDWDAWGDFSKDVHWSYRRAGEPGLTSVVPGEAARIVVPADVPEAVYEFVATCTGKYYEMVDIEFKLRGVQV